MKINEILTESQLDEGPLDFIKKVGAGIAGAGAGMAYGSPIQGAKAGYAQKGAQLKQQDLVQRVSQKAIADWGTHMANLQASGNPVDANAVSSWFTQYTKTRPSTQPVSTSAAGIQQWLVKEIGNYMANKASAQPAQPKPPTDQQPQAKTQASQATPEEDELDWNPKTNMLSINGVQYLRTKQGWQDYNTKEVIAANDAAELNTAFDKATGRAPVPQSTTAQQQTAQPKTTTQQPTTQQPVPQTQLPDVSQLTTAERDALRKQLQTALGQA